MEGTENGQVIELDLHFRFVEQVSGLELYAPHLRSLNLSSNNIRRIEGLLGMAKLKELKLYGCQLTRVQGLEECPVLAALHLEDNQISAIDSLGHLRNLEYLNLNKNKIQKLGQVLSKLSKLKELHVSQNQLSSLEGVAGLGNLEILSACQNNLKEVRAEHLKGLGKLDELRLSRNNLTRLSFLQSSSAPLASLATLDVSKNLLTNESLRSLPVLNQIIELDLSGNGLTDLPKGLVRSCPSLEILDLSCNSLDKMEDLACLKDLACLHELQVEENPISQDLGALRLGLAPLAALEYLNNKPLPPPTLAIEAATGGGAEETFQMTMPLAVVGGPADATQDLALLRPASSSRPTTASTRPGTAQSMKEAGVRDPLMHLHLKVSDRRFANEEQVTHWERQTLNSLAAIQAQVDRTSKQADAELADMSRFLQRADEAVRRQKELMRRGVINPVPAVAEETAQELEEASSPSKPSSSQRLRDVVGQAREGEDEDEAEFQLPSAVADLELWAQGVGDDADDDIT